MNNELTEALVQALTESDNTISESKQRFIDYCKDKVQDLGEMKIHSEEPYYDNGTVYQIYLIEPKFRDAEPAYCLNDEDEGALLVANEKGEIKVGTARIIRDSLPNATYVGFTGTPIATRDRNTREVMTRHNKWLEGLLDEIDQKINKLK